MVKSRLYGTTMLLALLCLSVPRAALPQGVEAEPAVLGSSAHLADSALRLDVLEVRRVSGDAVIIRWRVTNTSGPQGRRITYSRSHSDFYFIDPAQNAKHGIMQDARNSWIANIHTGAYGPDERRLNWALFPAPPPSSTSVTVHVTGFEPIFDVPVTE
jgi:hypothetical protein